MKNIEYPKSNTVESEIKVEWWDNTNQELVVSITQDKKTIYLPSHIIAQIAGVTAMKQAQLEDSKLG